MPVQILTPQPESSNVFKLNQIVETIGIYNKPQVTDPKAETSIMNQISPLSHFSDPNANFPQVISLASFAINPSFFAISSSSKQIPLFQYPFIKRKTWIPEFLPYPRELHTISFEQIQEHLNNQKLEQVFENLVKKVTYIMRGDDSSAILLIYSLVSRVQQRIHDLLTGYISTNFILDPAVAGNLYDHYPLLKWFVRTVCPFVHFLELSKTKLENEALIPIWDSESEILRFGRLQSPDSSLFLIDETSLSESTLSGETLLHLGGVQQLLLNASLPLRYEYYHVEYPCNYSFLCFSKGKSILQGFSFSRRLQPKALPSQLPPELSKEELSSFRAFFSLIGQLSFNIDLKTGKLIQEDWVSCRSQLSTSQLPKDSFHLLLNFLQCRCSCLGKLTPDLDDWKYVVSLYLELSRSSSSATSNS